MTAGGFDSREFRNALGRFATGVTVVTTRVGDGVHGMTANAFTSVSLDPPLVLVSVANQARMHRHLVENPRFGVNVLSEDQLAYAWNFAGRPQEGLQPSFLWRHEVPLLTNALAHFVCAVETSYPGGDHTLFLSRVEDLWQRDGSPLTFYRGRFFGVIPLTTELWAPDLDFTPASEHEAELSLLDPWW